MSFLKGFIGGVAGSIDTAIKQSMTRINDFNDEMGKLKFESQIKEADEWNDEVDEIEEALKYGATAFVDSSNRPVPNAAAYAAAALKRSGNLQEYNEFIAELKKARKNNQINPIDYFEQLGEDFEISSYRDYAKAYTGPMKDFSQTPIATATGDAFMGENLLSFILGKKVNTTKQVDEKFQSKLKAVLPNFNADISGTDTLLPSLAFADYKFSFDQLKPQEKLKVINEKLSSSTLSDEQRTYYTEQQPVVREFIRAEGDVQQLLDANNLILKDLLRDPKQNAAAIASIRNENIELTDSISLLEAEISGDQTKIIDTKMSILSRKIVKAKEIEKMKEEGDPEAYVFSPSALSNLATLEKEYIELNNQKEDLNTKIFRTEKENLETSINRLKVDIEFKKQYDASYIGSAEELNDKKALNKLEVTATLTDRDISPQTLGNIESAKNTFVKQRMDALGIFDSYISKDGTFQEIEGGPTKQSYYDKVDEFTAEFFNTFGSLYKLSSYPEFYLLADTYKKDNSAIKLDDKISILKGLDVYKEIVDETTLFTDTALITEKDVQEQTKKALEQSVVEPPEAKPSQTYIDEFKEKNIKIKMQNDYPLNNDGIEKFVKNALLKDTNSTASEIASALKELHDVENISNEQLTFIKSKIVDYSKGLKKPKLPNQNQQKPKLGDGIVNWFKTSVKSIIENSSVSNVIGQARTDYNLAKSKNNTADMSEVIDSLNLYLKDKNYSDSEIQNEIDKIVKPVNLYSGGLMSRKN